MLIDGFVFNGSALNFKPVTSMNPLKVSCWDVPPFISRFRIRENMKFHGPYMGCSGVNDPKP